MRLLVVLLFAAVTAQTEDCQTPSQQPGKCVLINHCPHLFNAALNKQNQTKNLIQESHCGFESRLFPKVCCPFEAVKYFDEGGAISQNQHATKCGWHEPDGPSDPWLGLLEYERRNGEKHIFCGGVLINKRYILTAAHCSKLIPADARLMNAYFGKNSDVILPTESMIVHEEYDPRSPHQYHDIALVRLKNKVSFKDGFVKPICIKTFKNNLLRKTLSSTGYEKANEGLKKRDGVATVWNNTDCHLVYKTTEVKLKDSQMCAGGRRLHYRHSLRHDIGGVLMHVSRDNIYSAVGVLSIQPECCDREDSPKVYTNVGAYIDWIFNHLKP